MSSIDTEVSRRRTFAIISHPDAGKTTITEKLLLYGGAIQLAGTVKAKRGKQFATSDWMEIERQRGISVTSSVLNFFYRGFELNLIDTPGHKDFSEDTYRTLTAVDSVLMVIDAAKGVEDQTRKLFEVCRLRGIPIIAFINKLDRPGREPFELLDDIEKVLGIGCFPFTWPVGQGDLFRGVYDRINKQLLIFSPGGDKSRPVSVKSLSLSDTKLTESLEDGEIKTLREEIEMLEGAGEIFDQKRFLSGNVTPVFFGSALNNFGVEPLLNTLINLAPAPQPRISETRIVDPTENKFSAFVFKVQANMDPSHRDRVAFLRVCSGQFERGMKVFHTRLKREQRLGRPTQFMAQDRSLVDVAYAGDIVGVHDPGVFMIGDTLSEGEDLRFSGIPVFAPENFARIILKDPLRSKHLNKALAELSEEGVVQLLSPMSGQEKVLGVVGALQFDVVKFRVEKEYSVKMDFISLPYSMARWITAERKADLEAFLQESQEHVCLDKYKNPVILIKESWKLKVLGERYPHIEFASTARA